MRRLSVILLSLCMLSLVCLLSFRGSSKSALTPIHSAPAEVEPAVHQLAAQATERDHQASRVPVARASHPSVKYVAPGRIRSFADPDLAKAYHIYFSLVGRAQRQYPFSTSGFDTRANAYLAYRTVLSADYRNPSDDDLRASVLAIDHLTHSGLASDIRDELTENLIDQIESASSERVAALKELDLRALLMGTPELTLDDISHHYRNSTNHRVRGCLAIVALSHLERSGSTHAETASWFAKNAMTMPDGLKPVSNKGASE